MSDTYILYAGVTCLALLLLGLALTAHEFRKMSSRSSSENASDPKRKVVP